ncbi:MAG: histidinol-phosphatase HisJ family protein [Acidobacteriota bacterium]|jgi:histidinol-phosphatase (PHP family)
MYQAYLDHHVHSLHSWDSESTPEELVAAARRQGLGGFVLTDHVEFDPSDMGYGYYNLARAAECVEETAELTPDLRIRFGAEISHQERFKEEIRDFLHHASYQYTIGSVHHVGREEITNFMARAESQKLPLEDCLDEYFDACLKVVASNLYDALGHLDFPKVFSMRGTAVNGDFWMEHYGKTIRRIVTASLDMGVFIEVNTAPYRKGFDEPFPGWAILDLYREKGGREVILSSDAHRPEDLGTAYGAVFKELTRRGLSVRNAVA